MKEGDETLVRVISRIAKPISHRGAYSPKLPRSAIKAHSILTRTIQTCSHQQVGTLQRRHSQTQEFNCIISRPCRFLKCSMGSQEFLLVTRSQKHRALYCGSEVTESTRSELGQDQELQMQGPLLSQHHLQQECPAHQASVPLSHLPRSLFQPHIQRERSDLLL